MTAVTAADVMTTPVTSVTEATAVDDLIKLIESRNYSGVPVLDPDGRVTGLVSQNDILRALAYFLGCQDLPDDFLEGKRRASAQLLKTAPGSTVAVAVFLKRPVRELMTPVVLTCKPGDPLTVVCQTMTEQRVHRVVVVDDDGKLAGIISALDVVGRYAQDLGRTGL
jgi:CBS domain-containing protein